MTSSKAACHTGHTGRVHMRGGIFTGIVIALILPFPQLLIKSTIESSLKPRTHAEFPRPTDSKTCIPNLPLFIHKSSTAQTYLYIIHTSIHIDNKMYKTRTLCIYHTVFVVIASKVQKKPKSGIASLSYDPQA